MNLFQIQEPEEDSSRALFSSDEVAIGIDLGTTNSLVCVFENDTPKVLAENGSAIVPSVIDYSGTSPTVGNLKHDLEHSLLSVKRFMGKSVDDALQNPLYSFKNDNGSLKLLIGDLEISPVEASAEILKYLKARAEKHTEKKATKAVITVPAYFDDAARQATKDAAEIAGLKVMRLINEPTAAAVAYGLDNSKEGIYAVYDLGGGTFDVTILSMQMGVFHVLSTGGNSELGGDDFDKLIMEYIFANFPHEELKNASQYRECIAKARRIKESLTNSDSYKGPFPYCNDEIEITYAKFEEISADLTKQTLKHFKQALKDAEVDKSEIEEIILVGGSTRMPFIAQKLEKFTGKKPLDKINPDEIVAIGAGIQAHNLTHGGDNLLLDVNPLSIGIEVADGLVEKIIYRNSNIPCESVQKFATQADNQTGFQIHVVQGESEKVDDCRSLARFELKGFPARPKGEVKLEVKYIIDADGILSVTATEMTTGIKQHVDVKPSYGLEREEILQLIKKAL